MNPECVMNPKPRKCTLHASSASMTDVPYTVHGLECGLNTASRNEQQQSPMLEIASYTWRGRSTTLACFKNARPREPLTLPPAKYSNIEVDASLECETRVVHKYPESVRCSRFSTRFAAHIVVNA